MSYSHQDWKPVVLKPKKAPTAKPSKTLNNTKTTDIIKKLDAGKNSQKETINSATIERKLEDGELKVQKVSKELQMQISQARQEKGLTQKQLANACNLAESVIKGYENGTAIPQQKELSKMGKVLGVTLKK